MDSDVILPSLKQLDLQGNKITNQGLPALWPEELEQVDLSGNLLSGRLDLSGLATVKELKTLKLVKNGLARLEAEGLGSKLAWRSLEEVDVSRNEFVKTDDVMGAFQGSHQAKIVS